MKAEYYKKIIAVVNEHTNPVYALAFGAHPDDVELSCGATLLKISSEDHAVAVCDLTKGEMGTLGTKETRASEAKRAMELMGYSQRITLDLGDSKLHYNDESLAEIIKVVRYFRPEVIFANPAVERHPDHMKAAKLVHDEAFYSGLKKIQTSWNNQPQEAHRPRHILSYMQFKHLEPSIIVDVSETFEASRQGVLAFASQFYSEEKTGTEQTMINRKEFLTGLEARARYLGEQIGALYGEGFLLSSPAGVRNFSNLFC